MAGRIRYLHVNNGTFRFQRRVPRELHSIVGRDVIIEQLKGARDRRDAEREVMKLAAHWNAEFE